MMSMQPNALSVANYFVELAQKEQSEIRLLGLMKRVYIAHGFYLAIFDKSFLDERFDKVEAWRYGPVIPSVYHSFKHNKKSPIKNCAEIMEYKNGETEFITPKLDSDRDSEIKKVCEIVWNRYKHFSDANIVELTHQNGTPWSLCYIEHENCIIPDSYTKLYYKKVIKAITNKDV